jgi:nucleotide-binding universal stress UspA family protein
MASVQHLIVPVDGSAESWRVVDVALELARHCSGHIEVVEVVFNEGEMEQAEQRLAAGLRDRAVGDVEVTCTAELTAGTVAASICEMVAVRSSPTVVMASRGQGRSAALLGSVAEDLLRCVDGPIVIVGPQAGVPDFTGPIIVTVDGSDTSEAAIPIAAAWSLELGATARVVHVLPPGDERSTDADELAYVSALAGRFSTLSGWSAEPNVLYGRDTEGVVADHAASIGASMIVTSTRGRSRTSRFVLGSTASGFVRRAPCPVLAIRPKHFN